MGRSEGRDGVPADASSDEDVVSREPRDRGTHESHRRRDDFHTGHEPVTMMTLMPAVLHLATAPGTASRGGSTSAIKPRKTRPSPDLGWGGSKGFPLSSTMPLL